MKKKLTVNTLALGNLKNRKKQYASLIIGIILAMVFSSSVLLMFSSLVASVYQQEKDSIGNQNGIYINATRKLFADAAGNQLVGDYAFARVVGEVFTQTDVSYTVAAYDEKTAQLANIQFIEGAYPQKENEIAVERSTLARLDSDAAVGDSITLRFAVKDGEDHLPQIKEKTYILSGIASNKLSNISGISSESNLVPSVFVAKDTQIEPGGKEMLVCYFNYYKTNILSNVQNDEKLSDFLTNSGADLSNWIPADSASFVVNNSNNGVFTASMFIILFALVLLAASCLGIVNAFSSNLNERKRQIGMLRTVGATKRQLIIILGREAFLISLICAPVSIALSCLIVKVGLMILGERFVFAPDIRVILLCAFIGIACVMLAALIPLIQAANVTPVQTVRNINIARKAARRRIKSRKSFVPSDLIAKRSLFFYGKTRAAASMILVITIVGSCYGFSAFDDMNDFDWLPQYEYEMQYSDYSAGLVNAAKSQNGFTYSEYSRVRSVPYAGEVNRSQHCKAFIVEDELSEYEKTVLYSDGMMSVYNDIGSFVRQLTPENVDEYITSAYSPSYTALRDYCGSKALLPITIVALESNVIENLSGSIDAGKIDIAALDSGDEVIAVAPRELAVRAVFESDDPNDGFIWGPDRNDDIKNDVEYLKRAKCDIRAGQELDISVVSSDAAEEPEYEIVYHEEEKDADIDTQNLHKTDSSVKVGALVSAFPDGFNSECSGISGSTIVLLTTLSGMKHFYESNYYSNINFNLNTECTDEIDAEISMILQNIVDSIEGYNDSFTSYYAFVNHENLRNTALLVSLLAILILFLSVSASIINNSLTAQIREGRREIGTLRAVGASVRELFGSYIRQLLSVLGKSFAVGFVLFGISYFVAHAVFKSNELEWFFKFNIWQTIIACILLFAVCGLNLWLKIKKEMQHSIIDNIREL